ncbi:MAG TPA: GNAT family N-acetyltransferase [Nocardioidaceae bacterium]
MATAQTNKQTTHRGEHNESGLPPYVSEAFLAEGSVAEVRSVEPSDKEGLLRLHAQASDESIRRRFFALNRDQAARYVEHVCSGESDTISLVAVLNGQIVGLVTAEGDGSDSAEVALFVDESKHGFGIGTLMLEHLAAWTYGHGIDVFHAEVLSDNLPMLRVFRDAGFDLEQHQDHGVVSVTLDVRPTRRSQAATDRRERHAERASLRPLFEPSAVAVIGVSRRRGGIGREIVENIRSENFEGRLLAVGHADLTIDGVEALADVDELPIGLDLAVVTVPAAYVLDIVERVAIRGTRVCVIVTSGLAETGESGREAEREVAAVARRAGMRVVGPNCFGVLSRLRDTRLNATFGTARPGAGGLAIGSQSGGVGIALMDAASRRNLGLAAFVSLGNKLDVSGNDLLAAWEEDPDIRVGALYLESFGNPSKFVRLASSFGHAKPLLAVFGGTSAAGRRGGASHTAASATPRRALDAVFRAAGVIALDGVADLVDTAALLDEQPLPDGSRIGLVSNAGGLGVLAADATQNSSLTVPALSEALQTELADLGSGVAGTSNPVDLGAGASSDRFAGAVSVLLGSTEVDALLVVVAATAVSDLGDVVAAVDAAVTAHHTKPCALVVIGSEVTASHGGATPFESMDSAVRALHHAAAYSAWRRTAEVPVDEPVRVPGTWVPPATPGWMETPDAAGLLADYGMPTVRFEVVSSPADAVRAADGMGYPVVAKTGRPDVVHKIERSLVHVQLRDGGAVAGAVESIQAECPGPVLVQQQLAGPELALGIVRDAGFGPLVMVATGGTNLALWNDPTFLLPPFSSHEALVALQALRTWPLLTGFRGAQQYDVDGLARALQQIGQLAIDWPQVAELDLNPVIVTASGPVCVDAKVRWSPEPGAID